MAPTSAHLLQMLTSDVGAIDCLLNRFKKEEENLCVIPFLMPLKILRYVFLDRHQIHTRYASLEVRRTSAKVTCFSKIDSLQQN